MFIDSWDDSPMLQPLLISARTRWAVALRMLVMLSIVWSGSRCNRMLARLRPPCWHGEVYRHRRRGRQIALTPTAHSGWWRDGCTGSAAFHWKSPAPASFGRLLLSVPAASACVECRHPTKMITTTMCRSVKQNKTGTLHSAPLSDWMAKHQWATRQGPRMAP